MTVHSVDSNGKGSGKKFVAPAGPVANPTGIVRVVRNPAVAPGATVAPGASARVLTHVTALPKTAAAPAQPTVSAAPTAGNADDVPETPVATADLGRAILQNFGIAPEAPTLQTRMQYVALANRLMASSPVQSAPAAVHDAPRAADAGGHTARTVSAHTGETHRIHVSA